ncbi:MAG: hypothetical protein Q9162_001625 [Coniocarpon cinnabarinum]
MLQSSLHVATNLTEALVDLTSEGLVPDSDHGEAAQATRKLSEEKGSDPVQHQIKGSSDDDFDRQEHEEFENRKRKASSNSKDKPAKKPRSAPNSASTGKRRARGRPTKQSKYKERFVYGLDSDEDNEEVIEAELPQYLKSRRSQFDNDRQKLQDAGLKLPPSYEEVDFSDDERLDELDERPSFPTLKPCAEYKDISLPLSAGIIPASIAQWLRDYQIKGAAFLHELFAYQRGGILGDDMGLGKTIQVIAFLTAAFGKTGDERDAKRMRKMRRHSLQPFYPKVLIVSPGTLMDNWKAELEKWGWWRVDTYHGTTEAKELALQSAKTGRLEIMITTYRTYQLNREAINLVEWDCVVADECHQIKEHTSEISTAMGEINALCRIGLTGTAIQNKYENLWNLLNWTNPGRFGPLKSWKTVISEPLKVGQSHDATQQQLAKARSTANKLVNNLLPRFFLRRMKTLIADQLPKKSDRVVFCPLTELQQEAYENFLDSEKVNAIRESTNPCTCGSPYKYGWCCGATLSDGSRWQEHVFPAIATLQRLCSHLASLIPLSNEDHEAQAKALENLQICCPTNWRGLFADRDSLRNFTNREFCGKWRVLRKLLAFWHSNGDKVLIFSHSKRLLNMLYSLLSTTSYTVSYLDGTLTYAERTAAVNTFNASPDHFAFLISTRAGGTGLNITSANKVIVVDPNWNPAHDLQAQDRAYRIGQQRDVEVFRLVSAGTIEEIVYARQVYKQQQANIGYTASHERRWFKGVMDKVEQKGEIFGLQNLFTFHGVQGNIVLRDIVNATNVAESKAGVSVGGVDMDSFTENEESQNDNEDTMPVTKRRDDDLGDEAMSQLADLIASGKHDEGSTTPGSKEKTKEDQKERKGNPISFILASAGVGYTHKNTDLLGSSRIEAKLSRHAAEAAGLHGSASHPETLGRKVFASQSQSQSFSQVNPPNAPREDASERTSSKKFHPDADIRRRQFCEMAKLLGWKNEERAVDVTGFAMAVESWSGKARRACLERFYGLVDARRENAETDGINGMDETDEDEEL